MKLTGLQKISTIDMSRDEWLAHRRHSIGGSDAATIVGLNPYDSIYALWADKQGLLPEKPETEAMRLGRDLEDYVAKRFTEATGKRVRRERSIIINPDYPFAHANVDRMVVGEDAGLECKTTSALNLSKFKGGEYPARYYAQCVHYMMVTGAKRWYLAVLVMGQGFYHFVIERDEEEITALATAEAEFWGLVESKTPPSLNGHPSEQNAIQSVLGASTEGVTIELTASVEHIIDEILSHEAAIKAHEAEVDRLTGSIKLDMGEAERGETSRFVISYATQHRRCGLDLQHFAKDHPGIDLTPYYRTSTSRPFKIKVKEK